MTSRLRWVVLGTVAAIVVATVLFLSRGRESLSVSAHKALNCLVEGDVDCAFEYASDDEIAVHAGNGSDLQGAIKLWASEFKGWKRVGDGEVTLFNGDSQATLIQPFRSPSGTTAEIVISVRAGSKKNEVTEYASFLLATMAQGRWPSSKGLFPKGREKLLYLGSELQVLTPALVASGLTGVAHYDGAKDTYRFEPLDRFIATLLAKGKPAE